MNCRRADDGRKDCPALVLVYFRLKWAGRSVEEKIGADPFYEWRPIHMISISCSI